MKRKSKSVKAFIRLNRQELDNYIASRLGLKRAGLQIGRFPHPKSFKNNDSDRHQWILNDEYLYMWARSEGVNI